MVRRDETVSIRIHPANKAVIDWLIFRRRAATGKGLTIDEILWEAFKKAEPEAVKAVLEQGATPPVKQEDDKSRKQK
jgi:hypothetical protein